MIKKVIYENAFGQKIVFDNKIFFCESIDTTGCKGIHSIETLAFADGQKTITHQLEGKTIPCSFAFKDIYDDDYLRNKIKAIFNPCVPGVLTVYNKYNKYEIDVYPQDMPSIEKDKAVSYVYRFDVDFIADFPFWRGNKHSTEIAVGSTLSAVINCKSDYYTPPYITFGGTQGESGYTVAVGKLGFSIKPYPKDVIVNFLNMKLVDLDGNNVNYLIDASVDFSKVILSPGENTVSAISSPADGSLVIEYYELKAGVL